MLAPIILNIGTDIISIYIFIQFLGQISYSLDESAIMDGASYPRVYFSIILPNLKPAIATVLIIKFVGIIPTLIIFLLLQKYIYSGLVSGAVKE